MSIAVLGRALPAPLRRAFADAGIRVGKPETAELRLYIDSRPPSRPPKSPWLWVTPRAIDPAHAASVVLAGAYDVAMLDAELPLLLQRPLAALTAPPQPPSPPNG